MLTVWLVQGGRPSRRRSARRGLETDEEQQVGRYAKADAPAWAKADGLRTGPAVELAGAGDGRHLPAVVAGPVGGRRSGFNERQLSQREDPVSWAAYLSRADFWNRTLQNWQSEFLAVASMAVLAVYLRQRGSPESKPVGAAHASTGVEG